MRAVRGILPRTPRERKACKWRGVEGVAFDPVFSSRLVDPWWFAARCLLFLLAMFVPCSLGFVLFQRVERGERLRVFASRGQIISRAWASGVVLSIKPRVPRRSLGVRPGFMRLFSRKNQTTSWTYVAGASSSCGIHHNARRLAFALQEQGAPAVFRLAWRWFTVVVSVFTRNL